MFTSSPRPVRKRRACALRVAMTALLLLIVGQFAPAPRLHADGSTVVWPMFHRDSAHTGLSPVNTASNPGRLKWVFTLVNGQPTKLSAPPATGNFWVVSSPAIGPDGTIYFGDGDGLVYALLPDGSLSWEYRTGAAIVSSPTLGPDGSVYIVSTDGYLYALSRDGFLQWKLHTGLIFRASPTVAPDGTIYIVDASGALNALNPDGTIKWQRGPFPGPVWQAFGGTPAVGADGTVYAWNGALPTQLYAYNPDGSLKWTAPISGQSNEIGAPAIGPDGTIYVADRGGPLNAVSPTGQLKWTFRGCPSVGVLGSTNAIILDAPAVGPDGTVYFYCNGMGGQGVYAVNADGTLKWRFPTGSWSQSSPAIGADGTIYVGDQSARLYALNPDGSLKWQYDAGVVVESSPAIGADGTIYVGSGDSWYGPAGGLHALGQAGSMLSLTYVYPAYGGNSGAAGSFTHLTLPTSGPGGDSGGAVAL